MWAGRFRQPLDPEFEVWQRSFSFDRRLIGDLCSAFVEQAEKAADAAMPAYTHLQPAEPVLIAHWLLAYIEMLLRDADRLQDCRARANICPLGSGAVAGTLLPLDRVAIA